jgi:3-phenylpropionate/trans-cinnamate dioxygenase ferredoxin subunit
VSSWQDVGSLDELERTGHVVGRVGGREIGVVLGPDGKPRALRNRCPHHGAPLCLGDVIDRLEAPAPGRYAASGQAVLRCPWHGWEFDLEQGTCLDEPSLRVAIYPARVENGRVLVRA